MKAIKIIAILLAIYVILVIVFESLLGYYQPADQTALVITTMDEDGEPNDRVLSRIDLDGKLYVAANHWPRAWFNSALARPEVRVTIDGEAADYLAVPVSDAEHEQLQTERALPLVVRILTGFPPRYFVRLDRRESDAGAS